MSNSNWETSLITKAINKTLSEKPKHPARRESIKQHHEADGQKSIKTH